MRTEGDLEGWVAFFLEGVADAASDIERGVVALDSLITDDRRLQDSPKAGPASYRLINAADDAALYRCAGAQKA